MNLFLLTCTVAIIAAATVVNGQLVTREQFNAAFKRYGTPGSQHYDIFIKGLQSKGGISGKVEAAMFLAQLQHESGGLQKRREDGCSGANGCQGRYPEKDEWVARCKPHPKGQSFYGRGFIQLTWCSNYIQASEALGLGDALMKNPDRVAQTDQLSWDVSFYYWKSRVGSKLGPNNVRFGETTKLINGKRECNGQMVQESKNRFSNYEAIFKAWALPGSPNPHGCYS